MAVLSMSEMTTYRWSFEEDVERYAQAGYQAIGVWRQKLSDFGEEKGIELLRDRGLAVSSLQWIGGFTGSDGRSLKESVEDAHEAIRLAGEMQAGCVICYTGARGGHTHNHARRLLRSALSELAPAAAERGVFLAVEPMHPGCAAECTFLTSLEETLALLDAIGSEPLKLVFDTYHLCQQPDVLEAIPAFASRIALVQLGDARAAPDGEQNRVRLGDGVLPLRPALEAIRAAGFDGYYEVELMGEEIEATDYQQLLSHSQGQFARLFAPP